MSQLCVPSVPKEWKEAVTSHFHPHGRGKSLTLVSPTYPSSTSEALQCTDQGSELILSPSRVADRPHPHVLLLIHPHPTPASWPVTTSPRGPGRQG